MVKFTFKERQQRGEDFLRFLQTDNVTVHGILKKELRNLYNGRYKSYLNQLNPGGQAPSFGSVLQPLFITKTLHLRTNRFYPGAAPNNASANDEDDNCSDEDGVISLDVAPALPSFHPRNRKPPFHKKYYQGQRKFALDQHKFFNKAEKPDTQNCAELSGSSSSGMFTNSLPEFIKKSGHIFRCILCAAPCTSETEVIKHVEGRRHRVAVLMHGLRSKRNELIKDKEGIQLSADCEGEHETFIISLNEGVPREVPLKIANNSSESITLVNCELLKRIRVFQLDDQLNVTESLGTAEIKPGQSYKITVKAEARNIGSFHTPIALQFQKNGKPNETFHIVRYLHARCRNQTIEDLRPINSARNDKKTTRPKRHRHTTRIIDGYPPPKSGNDKLQKTVDLKTHHIPESLRQMINHGLTDRQGLKTYEVIEMSALKSMLDQTISVGSYQRRLSVLLHFEEIQMEVDIRQYDIEEATMIKYHANKRLLLLTVPGLAENRPSVLKGDWLFVRILDDEGNASDKEYQGFVHEVLQNEVALGFSDSLMRMYVPNMKFSVRFVFNRLPLRLQHRACELADENSLEKLLFPSRDVVGTFGIVQPVDAQMSFYSRNPSINTEQEVAVRHILAGTSRPAPYLVFGPPGTGKTFTIVEAMKQIWKCIPSAHILACAPSNAAADLITKRLLDNIPRSAILRLNAVQRAWNTVMDEIKDVCNYEKMEQKYYFPMKEDIMNYSIVVTTLITAGRLASANFPSGHFTHVFIDEAGYAVEPECIIAVAGILDCNPLINEGGQLILAGDPKQLGPILRSPFAKEYHLDMSLLERYMEHHDIYWRKHDDPINHYDNQVMTKLVKNYRSHAAILKQSNEMFYDGELEECAPEVRKYMCNWEGLPRPGFPLIFHSVIGEDMREQRSPSFFNPEEISIVLDYVKKLVGTKVMGKKIIQEDIGIITPYRKQVQKIKKVLQQNRFDMQKLKVGSVEEFQGAERVIIIVSTVRSNPKYLSMDFKFNLGFLQNPKRFNVTVTRPKALLIVSGNPNTLQMDDHWSRFIQYCKENGGVAGEDFTDVDQHMEDVLQRLLAVNLQPDIPDAVINTDQPWRKEL